MAIEFIKISDKGYQVLHGDREIGSAQPLYGRLSVYQTVVFDILDLEQILSKMKELQGGNNG